MAGKRELDVLVVRSWHGYMRSALKYQMMASVRVTYAPIVLVIVVLALIMAVARCLAGSRALNVELELEQVEQSAIANVPSELTARVENRKLLIANHLIATNSHNESDIHVTASVDGNTITVLEEMGNPNYVSSLLSTFKLAEIIDTQSLPPDTYSLIVKRHSWEIGSKSQSTSGHWADTTILRQQVVIDQ